MHMITNPKTLKPYKTYHLLWSISYCILLEHKGYWHYVLMSLFPVSITSLNATLRVDI